MSEPGGLAKRASYKRVKLCRRQIPWGLALLALGFSGVVSNGVRDLEGVCGRRGRACEGGSGGVGSSRGS